MFSEQTARSCALSRRRHRQRRTCENDYRWSMRALLLSINRWIKQARRRRRAGLQDCRQHAGPARFAEVPSLDGVGRPYKAHKAYARVQRCSRLRVEGIVSVQFAHERGVPSSCPRWMPTATSWPAEDAGRSRSTAGDLHRLELSSTPNRVHDLLSTLQDHLSHCPDGADRERRRSAPIDRRAYPTKQRISRPRRRGGRDLRASRAICSTRTSPRSSSTPTRSRAVDARRGASSHFSTVICSLTGFC